MAVLCYLPKLERSLGLAFDAHFLHDLHFLHFLHKKCSLFNSLSMDKTSMSHLFSFSRYQTKCVIKFLVRQLMISWTLRFIFSHALKQWPTGRKRGEDGNTKIWISWARKELFRWNKKQFSQSMKGYHLANNKNLIKNSGHQL